MNEPLKESIDMDPEILRTPDGEEHLVTKLSLEFSQWTGPRPSLKSIWARKPLVVCQGEPLVAELAIVKVLEAEGWNAVWVSCFGGITFNRNLPGHGDVVQLPEPEAEAFNDILRRQKEIAGTNGGCWDVWAWKAGARLFLEAKLHAKDRIRKSQLYWLQVALSLGYTAESFRIVEWNLR